MDALFLSRLQFAITIGFHFLFPPITIGLAWLLVFVEGRAWRTGDPAWERLGKFFAKLLALTFAVGVATGVVMEFQFGTNWARYSKFVGDIFGAPLAAEGVFAFFLESGFLGLYLFGRGRVGRGTHWFSIVMVAVGSTISAFWILAANSWQQTPAGYRIDAVLGRAELVSFADAIFNPSMWPRFFHTTLASLVCGAFFMAGVAAWLALRGRAPEETRRALAVSVAGGLAFSLLTAFPTGHEHARQVARTQPEKFAAIEGLYETSSNVPLVAFGLVRDRPPELRARLEVPVRGLLGWLAFGHPGAEIRGIDAFPEDERPPLWLTFVSFHNMVILGTWFVGLMGIAALQLVRGRLAGTRWLLRALVFSAPLPLVACQFGWVAAEVGRQPWAVYRLLRTSEALSPGVSAGQVLFSILLFGVVYMVLGGLYLFLLGREIAHGPEGHPELREG